MRILHIFDQYRSGGFERHLDLCVSELKERGFEQFLYGAVGVSTAAARNGIARFETSQLTDVGIQRSLIESDRIEAFIREEQIDVVHMHPGLALLPGSVAALASGRPYVVTFHSPPRRSEYESTVGSWYLESLDRIVLKYAAAITAVSEETGGALDAGWSIPRGRIAIVRNPIDFPASIPDWDGPPHASLLSRLDADKEKSCRAVLELFSELKKRDSRWTFSIYGEGFSSEAIVGYAGELGLDGVEYRGEYRSIEEAFRCASLVAGMGRVVPEAIAGRRNVVLAGYDGLIDLITEQNFSSLQRANFSGRLEPVITASMLAEKIHRELEPIPAGLYEAARISHERRSVVDRYVALYESITKAPSAAGAFVRELVRETARSEPAPSGRRRELETLIQSLGRQIDRLTSAGAEREALHQAEKARLESRSAKAEELLASEKARLESKAAALEVVLKSETARLEAKAAQQQAEAAKEAARLESKAGSFETAFRKASAEIGRLQTVSAETHAGLQRFSAELDRLFGLYRSQKAWSIMLAIRKAYTLLLRRGFGGRFEFLKWALSGFRLRGLEGQELPVPSIWSYVPEMPEFGKAVAIADPAPVPYQPVAPARHDVIILPIFDFEFRYQRPQQIAAQFARNGHRVYWVSPTRMRPADQTNYELVPIRMNLFEVYLPGKTLNLYGGRLEAGNREVLLEALDALYRDEGIAESAVIAQFPFWRPIALALRERHGARVVYDCMDDWENWPAEPRIGEWTLEQERHLVKECDVLTVSGKEFFLKHSEKNLAPLLVRNGVDFNFFSEPVACGRLDEIARPIIGYYGAIAPWFDLELMTEVVRTRPYYSFVFIGQVHEVDVTPLKSLPNAHFLGEKNYRDLPSFLCDFNVALIPFRMNQLTKGVDPVKVYEYLSQGKPVVATPMPELASCGDVVRIAGSPAEFAAEIDLALKDEAGVPARVEFARRNTWSARTEQIESAIAASFPKVSVIVLTYNSKEFLRPFWDSFLRNTTYPNWELIFVDNASSDGTHDILEEFAEEDTRLRFLPLPKNIGFAAGNNAAARTATGDYLLFLNPDTIVTRGWLGRLVQACQSDGSIGLAGPVTNFSGNESRINTTYHDAASLEAFAHQLAKEKGPAIADLPMAALFCALVPRHVWEKAGELDEQFRVGMFEDDDFSRRVRDGGYRIVSVEGCLVHHFGNGSFAKLPSAESVKIFEQNRERFEKKWGEAWKPHSTRPGVAPLTAGDTWAVSNFIGSAVARAAPERPALDRIHPSSTTAGSKPNPQADGSAAIVVECRSATPDTSIQFDGITLQTSYGSPTMLSAVVPEHLLAMPGSYGITLINELGVSNSLQLTIEPAPLAALSAPRPGRS